MSVTLENRGDERLTAYSRCPQRRQNWANDGCDAPQERHIRCCMNPPRRRVDAVATSTITTTATIMTNVSNSIAASNPVRPGPLPALTPHTLASGTGSEQHNYKTTWI